jgi:hypothetical protein
MTEAPKRHRWTNKALQAEVDKLDDEVEIYWDYRDELGEDDIVLILDKGLEGVDEVEMELTHLNDENLNEARDREIDQQLEYMRKRHPVSESAEKRFREMVDESDKLQFSAALKDLARRTEADFVVILEEPEMDYQAYRGVQTTSQVADFCKLFELLNVNPEHFQKWVTADNDDRPSYDPDPVIFPSHPERDGHEFVTLEHVHDIMNETNYGGRLMFMVRLKVSDLIEEIDAFKAGPIKVHKGTYCFPYCTMNGAGPCAEMILQKDLILPAGSFTIRLDSKMHYGIQSCYGFTAEPWKAGHITTLEEKPKEDVVVYPYGQTHPLLTEIQDVECWNKSSAERFTLPAGTLLKIEHAYDATHTTCMAQDPDIPGKSLELYPGAYRWIIGNQILAAAIGIPMPERTRDIVGEIIAAES